MSRPAPAVIAFTRLLIPSLLILSGCTSLSQGIWVSQDRYASLAASDYFGDSALSVVHPEQNWSAADSLWFYNTTQGSTLLPYDVFLHLETADSPALFRSDDHMNRLRYLPQKASFSNPDGLPLGWVKDEHQGKAYIGLTCAACHTGQINYRGTAIRIDGAPPLADMELMMTRLAAALDASAKDAAKFDRLAQKLGISTQPEVRSQFRADLQQWADKLDRYNTINVSTHGAQYVAYGYGRLDAFGRIYNRILTHLTPGQTNRNPANAPISYPQLWDTPQHDHVQWNGIGDNAGDGPLKRNAGEALGVFATYSLQQHPGDPGFRSSIDVRNLVRMENHLKSLWSPRWEDLARQQVLPAIDQTLADQGRQVYLDYQCHTCHQDIDRTDRTRRITARFSSLALIGTDPTMARNALQYQGKSGWFEGRPAKWGNPDAPPFKEQTRVLPALSFATAGAIAEPDHDKSPVRRWLEKIYDLFASIGHRPFDNTERHLDFEIIDKDNPVGFLAYKARPLNGIWATAPYLHNGSVPSLYELLLPSCSDTEIAQGKRCRPNRFTLGNREFDPDKVGFVQRDAGQYPGLFVFDTHLPGNANTGHEYAAGITPVIKRDSQGKPLKDAQGKPLVYYLPPISETQRLALVEYLKTL